MAMLIIGIGIIAGTIIFGVSVDRSVPQGVDLGFEIFYLIAFLVGGIFIFLSTRSTIRHDN
jgi:predicted MFS family arabinose efflux permease